VGVIELVSTTTTTTTTAAAVAHWLAQWPGDERCGGCFSWLDIANSLSFSLSLVLLYPLPLVNNFYSRHERKCLLHTPMVNAKNLWALYSNNGGAGK